LMCYSKLKNKNGDGVGGDLAHSCVHPFAA